MRILTLKALREFWQKHPEAESPLRNWHKVVTAASWSNLAETRTTFPTADEVKLKGGKVVTVFNIAGNNYRLVAHVRYDWQKVYINRVMTHAEYSKGRWKEQQ